jgi:hypothetical protein
MRSLELAEFAPPSRQEDKVSGTHDPKKKAC